MPNQGTYANPLKGTENISCSTAKVQHCTAPGMNADSTGSKYSMNQLNETLRVVRVQIAAEEMKERPDIERLKKLRKEEQSCIQQLMK